MKASYAVNERITQIIKERGIRCAHVAKMSGLTSSDVYRITRNERPVYAEEIIPIAEALNVGLNELVPTTKSA
ncbi:MAG: helix-turn-helix transcriptional regulator [Eubacteriales bacterium]|nr:helix-turn-helix transcriptional regulator [Eubacteriales bacterium]